jgi:hypothetical protein
MFLCVPLGVFGPNCKLEDGAGKGGILTPIYWYTQADSISRMLGEKLAVLTQKWNGAGILQFDTGRRFMWGATDPWGVEWAFTHTEEGTLISFKSNTHRLADIFKHRVKVDINTDVCRLPQLSVLELLGCYLMVSRVENVLAVAGVSFVH